MELKDPTDERQWPVGWRKVRLTNVARLESGHTPSKKVAAYWGGQVPWVSLHDTDGLDCWEIRSTTQTITDEGLANSSARLLPKGTVVFSRTATVGKATVLAVPMATSQDFACYVCGPAVHNHFLALLLRSMRSEWTKLMAGSIHNTVYMPVFEALEVVLPQRAEQEDIAEALRDADALIDSLEHLLTKKRQIKQGAMQELLTGRRRLPGFAGDWYDKPLGDLLMSRPEYGINAPAVEYRPGLPTYLRITDIDGDGNLVAGPRVSVDRVDAELYYLSAGDIVFARTGASVGKSYLYKPTDGPLVFAGFLIRARPDVARLESQFLFYFTQTRKYWSWVTLMSMRSGQPGINGQEFATMIISVPSVVEQRAIAQVLSDLDADIAAVEARLVKARDLKQAMMQVLLTGRIRLVAAGD